MSTYLKVSEKNWDADKQRCRYSRKGLIEKQEVVGLNIMLDSIRFRAMKIYLDHQVSGEILIPNEFKRLMTTQVKSTDFYAFLDQQLELYSLNVAPNTMRHVRRMSDLLRGFRKKIEMGDLTYEFVQEFEGYLKRKKLAPNTRAKVHRDLKIFVRKAMEKYKFKNPFENFKMPRAEVNRVFLLKNEVQQLIEIHDAKVHDEEVQMSLQKYLFSCHCGGLRISDIHSIGSDDIVDGTLVFVPQKTKGTNKMVKIPFSSEFYRWTKHQTGSRFFDIRTDQHINRCLKVVADDLGWKKQLTFHTARHTFATGYLAAGGSIEVLQQILRHSKIETTQEYVHITNSRIRDEMDGLDLYGVE